MSRTWWVNQSKSTATGDGYDVVWAPRLNERRVPVVHWDRLLDVAVGDLILHYASGAVRGFSIATSRAVNQERPYNAGTWNNEGRRINVEYSPLDIPVALGDIPADLRRAEGTTYSVFDKNLAVNQGYFYEVRPELAKHLLGEVAVDVSDAPDGSFIINGSSDREGVAKYRTEQPALRKHLLAGNDTAACGLCGRQTPERYLVAAHIKPRAKCSEKERADVNVGMLICTFGCDAAFECGDIVVGEDGRFVIRQGIGDVRSRLSGNHGFEAPGFSEANKKYFRAHRLLHAKKAK